MPQFMIIFIPYINLLNLSWIKKMSIFEEYGPFKMYTDIVLRGCALVSRGYALALMQTCYLGLIA